MSGSTRLIDASGLPEALVEAIESLVRTYREKTAHADAGSAGIRPIGWLKGEWEVPESFFEALPTSVLNLFEGRLELT